MVISWIGSERDRLELIWLSERFRYLNFSFHAASFSPFFLAAALQNRKDLHEILYVTVWRARLLSRWPGAICVSALGRKRCALLWKVRCAAIHSSTRDGDAVAALGGRMAGLSGALAVPAGS